MIFHEDRLINSNHWIEFNISPVKMMRALHLLVIGRTTSTTLPLILKENYTYDSEVRCGIFILTILMLAALMI